MLGERSFWSIRAAPPKNARSVGRSRLRPWPSESIAANAAAFSTGTWRRLRSCISEHSVSGRDTAFGRKPGGLPRRLSEKPPAEAGGVVTGTDAGAVRDVIITHLHYDHAGNLELFPMATFHLQDREMAFATGRHMCSGCLRYAFEVEDVIAMMRAVYADRVMFHDGDDEVASGVSVRRVGGHTGGLQMVRVQTGRGPVVLASDASHYYANMERENPYPVLFD